MTLEGKGFYIWKIHKCEGGNPNAILDRALDAGLTHVLIKVADGSRAYNVDLAEPVVEALRGAGLQVWGWQYVYGEEPFGEADIAAHRIKTLGLDGFVVNAEIQYKKRHAEASAYMDRLLRRTVSGLPIALSSFRYPHYHPELPWTEFLSQSTYNMPQVYWIQADNPDEQLKRSIKQFKDYYPVLPVFPTGSAYEEFGWRPKPSEIKLFMQSALDLGLSGANFWSWDYAGSSDGKDLWKVIADFDWPTKNPLIDMTDALVKALNERNLDHIQNLYHDNAVIVTSRTIIYGKERIRAYYQDLLNQLPDAAFVLETRVKESNIRHIKWDARHASNGNFVDDAQDTIGIRRGKIQYHSSVYRMNA